MSEESELSRTNEPGGASEALYSGDLESANRRLAELARENQELARWINRSGAALVQFDGDLRLKRFSAQAQKILHLSSGDVGLPAERILFNIRTPHLGKALSEALRSASDGEFEVQDWKGRWYRAEIRAGRGGDGRPEGLSLALYDIDRTKRDMDLLERRTERLERAQRAGRVGLFDWDLLSDDIYFSDEVRELYGFSASGPKMDYGRWIESVHPDDRKRVFAEAKEALISADRVESEFRVLLPGGGVRWVAVLAEILRSGDHKPVRVVGVNLDVTARKRAEESLLRREQEQKDFVANFSHDLRTPVASIRCLAETLRTGALQDRRNRLKFVKSIEKNAVRVQALIEDQLALSALESGKVPGRPKPVSLPHFIRESVRGVAPLASKKGVTIEIEAEMELKAVMDAGRLERVLENLLSNAIKYNRKGGLVHVGARRDGKKAVVFVRDNGIGIAARDLQQIFERFYRADRSRSLEEGATGLGLPIVKRIVEEQGGRVWVESQEGKGSSFFFTLPLAE